MTRKLIILFVVVTSSLAAFGQPERQAYQNIRKGKWEKAYAQLQKAMRKDTLRVAASYTWALYYFERDNPQYQLDSANRNIQKALYDYGRSTRKELERLARFPVDSVILTALRQQIDSAAFHRAKELNTTRDYQDFIDRFPSFEQQAEAVALRDEAAYLDAVHENTHQAFNNYRITYPNSLRSRDALANYEALLYDEITRDKHLKSYERYLADYPNTSYQVEAERNIFEILTAEGTIESYAGYLANAQGSHFRQRAKDILFHLIPEEQIEEQFPADAITDSLRTIIRLDRSYIVPFLHHGEFGFMDPAGSPIIHAETDEIRSAYRCGNIGDDVIILPQKMVALNGATIYNKPVDDVDDLGSGFLLVRESNCTRVLHKTGFSISDGCVGDARVVNGKFLALLKDGQWSLWTFTGRQLLPNGWDQINSFDDVIVLKVKDKYTLTTESAVAHLADEEDLGLREFVDEVSRWKDGTIWVRKGEEQGVLNQVLDTIVAIRHQMLTPTYFGSTARNDDGIQLINEAGDTSAYFQHVLIREPHTTVKTIQGWRLFDPKQGKFTSSAYDSIVMKGPFAIGQKKDSIRIFFTGSHAMHLKPPAITTFDPGKDSSSFLIVEQGDKKSVYGRDGRKLFTAAYDRLQYAGEGLFVVYKKDKAGLVSAAGKVLLPVEYDAIGSVSKGVVSVLKNQKFGLFDYSSRKLIKPQYAKNVSGYTARTLTAYKDGVYGFVDWDNKPLSKMEFNEIQYWNDSAALVRKNFQWMIYEIKTQRTLLDQIKNVKLIRDHPGDKLAIVQQEHSFGVIHNKKGTIIPLSFSDIINVGSPEEPLYFTEKHVEEASIFVVIYYDAMGNMLRKEVYEQDDYEKIYCSNN